MTADLAASTLAFEELRAGDLGVRLAQDADEVDASQALRYRVFYDEMGAVPDAEAARSGRDSDAYDQSHGAC